MARQVELFGAPPPTEAVSSARAERVPVERQWTAGELDLIGRKARLYGDKQLAQAITTAICVLRDDETVPVSQLMNLRLLQMEAKS